MLEIILTALGVFLVVWVFREVRRRPARADRITYGPPVNVDYVFDGDTIRVREGNTVLDGDSLRPIYTAPEYRVRLLGVDAPEVANRYKGTGPEPYAAAAQRYVRGLLKGKSVRLAADPARPYPEVHGRELRYVMLPDGTDLGERLLFYGLAREMTFQGEGPYALQARYRAVEADARANRRGMWA